MRDADSRKSEPPADSSFASTRWSLIIVAGIGNSSAADAALNELCRIYWYPLYCYLRKSGRQEADAKDLVQGFFARLLERKLFTRADRTKGKMRAFLLSSLQGYVVDEKRRAGAIKRGGAMHFVPLDTTDAEARYAGEPADIESPDRLYDRRWAITVLERAAAALGEVWQRKGKRELFDALCPFLHAELDKANRLRIADRFGMTEGHVKVSLNRLCESFGSMVECEVADTVSSKDEVKSELATLKAAVA